MKRLLEGTMLQQLQARDADEETRASMDAGSLPYTVDVAGAAEHAAATTTQANQLADFVKYIMEVREAADAVLALPAQVRSHLSGQTHLTAGCEVARCMFELAMLPGQLETWPELRPLTAKAAKPSKTAKPSKAAKPTVMPAGAANPNRLAGLVETVVAGAKVGKALDTVESLLRGIPGASDAQVFTITCTELAAALSSLPGVSTWPELAPFASKTTVLPPASPTASKGKGNRQTPKGLDGWTRVVDLGRDAQLDANIAISRLHVSEWRRDDGEVAITGVGKSINAYACGLAAAEGQAIDPVTGKPRVGNKSAWVSPDGADFAYSFGNGVWRPVAE